MRSALIAEWTKQRTTPGAGWLLLITVASTVGLGAAVCAVATDQYDTVRLALSGVYLGQAPVAVLGVLAASGEYSSGLIRVTVAAMPGRSVVLAAKAVVIAVEVAVVASLALLVSVLVASQVGLSVAGEPVLRAGAGSAVYLVLVALLSLGVAVVVRDSAAAIGAVLGLLYLPPILTAMVTDPGLHRLLERAAPISGGLGVLTAWSGGFLVFGVLLFRSRDV
ncbi:ABC transporter permease [Actinoplanes subtropicus]|uniref:ABC transporter permease n=1 Tax=Actinoplanes subtropicus TaxID=543632 RepID=UPI0004C38149|nr:ABC transporter permease [Actinoplanes subtropicus]